MTSDPTLLVSALAEDRMCTAAALLFDLSPAAFRDFAVGPA